MTPELWMLFAAAVLGLVHNLLPAVAKSLIKGPTWAFGNRHDTPPLESWGERSQRAAANYYENLALFVILIVVAILAKKTNSTTALGAQIFVGARVAYVFIYLAGIPYLRTATWCVSIAGLGMIGYSLF